MLKLGIPGPSHPLFFYRFLIMFVFSYVFCLWLSVVCTSSSILWHEVNLNCLFGIMCQVCSTKKCKQEVNQVGKSGQPVLQRTFLPVCLSALDEFTFCSQPPPHPPGPCHCSLLDLCGQKVSKVEPRQKGPVCQESSAAGRLASFPVSQVFRGVSFMHTILQIKGALISVLGRASKVLNNHCLAFPHNPVGKVMYFWAEMFSWKCFSYIPRVVFLYVYVLLNSDSLFCCHMCLKMFSPNTS